MRAASKCDVKSADVTSTVLGSSGHYSTLATKECQPKHVCGLQAFHSYGSRVKVGGYVILDRV
jgi:hypothetical protein